MAFGIDSRLRGNDENPKLVIGLNFTLQKLSYCVTIVDRGEKIISEIYKAQTSGSGRELLMRLNVRVSPSQIGQPV